MLGTCEWLTVVAEAASGTEAITVIEKLKPELAFLDIEMPGASGVDVLRRVKHQPYVVFTTAYSEYAVTAFELGALDYLVKPFGPSRLALALDRVRSALGEPAGTPQGDRLAEAFGGGPMSRIFVRSGNAMVPVAVANVAWFTADGDYVEAHGPGGRHVLRVSLNRIERRLDPAKFTRIHRTHIVNLDHVVAFRRAPNGRMVAEMRDGTRLPVSRQRAPAFRVQGA
jgi:two-component system LytT family response regulator